MDAKLSRRQEVVLAAFATEQNSKFAPVQVQKMFFLFDENISADLDGKLFSFEPYDFGPFDSELYSELQHLNKCGLVMIEDPQSRGRRRYSLTPNGQDLGEKALRKLPQRATAYMREVSRWVRSLSFSELVGSIYKSYPAMKVNSVFRG